MPGFVIIWLVLSASLCLKVITLSGFHCTFSKNTIFCMLEPFYKENQHILEHKRDISIKQINFLSNFLQRRSFKFFSKKMVVPFFNSFQYQIQVYCIIQLGCNKYLLQQTNLAGPKHVCYKQV